MGFPTIKTINQISLATGNLFWREIMAVTLFRDKSSIYQQLFNPMRSSPLPHGFHLSREQVGHSESRSPQLAGNWNKRENSDHGDVEEEVRLHELMEDIKRYIRSIDVNTL
jgi:hypothetical protein